MPRNVEIKAIVADMAPLRSRVAAISDGPPRSLRQRDTFFRCTHGRLKLREAEGEPAELISYRRADAAVARESDFQIAPVADAAALRDLLARSLGVIGTVVKTRLLFHVGQTRVHLDSVDGLGEFLEVEVVLRPGQTVAEGQAVAGTLLDGLGIRDDALCATAYVDMLGGNPDDRAAQPPH